jgi:hypothetical protein
MLNNPLGDRLLAAQTQNEDFERDVRYSTNGDIN